MRKQIVIGNWKMNKNIEETRLFLEELILKNKETQTNVMVSPSFTNLALAVEMLKSSAVEVVAQNMHLEKNGAYTGEVSADMLKSVGVQNVILGHSERRAYFGETNAMLSKKVDAAIENNMTTVFCFGENLEDRKGKIYKKAVASQLKEALFHLEKKSWQQIILAYEPVWAIGTGETATPLQAQEMHVFVREIIAELYDVSLSQSVPILYGGSVKPNNAKEIFSQSDVDGGLIGGAALLVEDFLSIINSM